MLNKKIIREYLSFSRRDRIAILTTVAIITGLYLLPQFFDGDQEKILKPNNLLALAVDTLEHRQAETAKNADADLTPFEPVSVYKPGQVFNFDPNTLSVEGWQRLGLSEKTSKTIEKYRLKGGRFYKPEDLQKIWGLPKGFYERVKDHITLSRIESPFAKSQPEKLVNHKAEKIITRVSINEADTTAFIALPGIGSKLATRIVSFRERLGGFYSVEQVKETYGITDSTFQKIKNYLVLNGEIKKININSVTKEELKKHPYFKWNLVSAIIEYRNQHGPFKSVGELKNIILIDEATFKKISNYLSL